VPVLELVLKRQGRQQQVLVLKRQGRQQPVLPRLMVQVLKLVVSLLELVELVEFQLLARLLLQLHLGYKS
jgi:hypothetical protein